MPLASGTRLGHYEILEKIGAGGMGEVYRARDTRLGRDVAIKVSAERFGERFEREARVIASLNHPNICTLFDVGPNYLVMELVEGATLAERIKEGPIPLEEALAISRQIADALEAAHEKGVVHRDLKPGNVKVKPDGAVKVLDFGLAKVGGTPTPTSENSPTIEMSMTQAGVILGTAAYMSPEQAKGKNVDKRADIWAFGVVLYEMLTGRQLFQGETLSETLASVMKEEPAWDRVPARVLKLLRACLQKDPRQRLHDIADAKLLLEEGGTEVPLQAQARATNVGWITAAVFVLAFALVAFLHFRETPPVARATRFQIPLPETGDFLGRMALSPDGRRLAINTTGPEGGLWVRDLDSLELRLLPGTQNAFSQFWSPDSRFIAFGVGNQLKKVDASGGPPQTLCEVPNPVGSGAWNQEGVIIFGGGGNGPLQRVSAARGVASELTTLDTSRGEVFHTLPSFLPDGRHFVYIRGSSSAENQGIFAGSLDVKPEEQSRERLLANRFAAVYAAGRLFFMRESTLMAQTFDTAKLKLVGDPVPVAEQVGTVGTNGFFSVSPNGAVLAYRTGGSATNRQLTWFDRQGKVVSTAGEPGPHVALSLSPDAMRAAILQGFLGLGDIWLYDFARGVSTRFTFDQTASGGAAGKGPVWSPDGSRIVFRATRRSVGDLYEKASSGAGDEVTLLQSAAGKEPNDWSRDGRFLLYTENPKTNLDLMVLPLEGDRKPIPLLRTPFAEGQGSFSPDTRWFSYASNESGRAEIYVQPFTPPGSGSPPAAGKWQVSRDGGSRPKWRADGKEIFFRARNGSPMAVDVTTSSTFQAGIPKQLFALPVNVGDWDVTADGKRFLVAMPLQQQNANAPITVVLNWDAGLKP